MMSAERSASIQAVGSNRVRIYPIAPRDRFTITGEIEPPWFEFHGDSGN